MKPKQVRRDEGDARNAAWASLSDSDKLLLLDKRLGKGVGAKRQRAKLAPKDGGK